MQKPLSETELASRLPVIDDELRAQGMPLHLRPLECFTHVYGSVQDNDGRKQLFDPITLWFVQRYGSKAMEWDGVIGRVPVILRGVLYLLSVPSFSQETLVEVIDQVEGVPNEVRNSLTREEYESLVHEMFGPAHSYGQLYTLRVDDGFLNQSARDLIRRALFDIENATHALYRTGDVQGAIFQAHAAGEKFVKAALAKIGNSKSPRAWGHDMPKAFADLVKANRGYGWLRKPVEELQRLAPNMDLRYSSVPRTLENAVMAIHASLFLCGSLAQMWQFERERGVHSPEFRPGKFYKDHTGLDHYCKSVSATQVEMLCFRSNKFTGSQTFTKIMTPEWCSLYLEVFEQAQEDQLKRRLLAHLRQPGMKVDPTNLSITHVDGPKGMYTIGMIRRKRAKS
jgi:HEPN domain-containing protein